VDQSRPLGRFDHLSPHAAGSHRVRVVIETPKGSRNKYAFNPKLGAFELHKVLPAGMAFPYDFGFVPATVAGDGDPLDVLVLMDEPAFVGCVLTCRLVGIVTGKQKAKRKREENDRLIAVEENNHTFATIKHLDDLGREFVEELEAFFTTYHGLDDETYTVTGTGGPGKALKRLKAALRSRAR